MSSLSTQHLITKVVRETYSGNKSTYATLYTNIYGYVRPLTDQQASTNGFQYGQGYMLQVSDDYDIQEGDKVTWDGSEYMVSGVARHNRGFEPFKRCLLSKPQKA